MNKTHEEETDLVLKTVIKHSVKNISSSNQRVGFLKSVRSWSCRETETAGDWARSEGCLLLMSLFVCRFLSRCDFLSVCDCDRLESCPGVLQHRRTEILLHWRVWRSRLRTHTHTHDYLWEHFIRNRDRLILRSNIQHFQMIRICVFVRHLVLVTSFGGFDNDILVKSNFIYIAPIHNKCYPMTLNM